MPIGRGTRHASSWPERRRWSPARSCAACEPGAACDPPDGWATGRAASPDRRQGMDLQLRPAEADGGAYSALSLDELLAKPAGGRLASALCPLAKPADNNVSVH